MSRSAAKGAATVINIFHGNHNFPERYPVAAYNGPFLLVRGTDRSVGRFRFVPVWFVAAPVFFAHFWSCLHSLKLVRDEHIHPFAGSLIGALCQ